MFLPSFRHLIEIEALKTQNRHDFEKISLEHKRISDIDTRREKSASLVKLLEDEKRLLKLTEKQLDIESAQQKIKRMKSQLEMASNEKEQHAFESQIHLQQKNLDQLEDIYFTHLERLEAIESEKIEIAQFLEGSLLTLNDIKNEVERHSKKYQESIDGRLLRIHSLEELCLPSFKKFYHELETKFAPKSPVAYLIDKKCTQCHMQVDSVFKASLEEGRSFEVCPNCGRLLIPETAKIY
ncbi:MAG: hypothetical protein KBD76_12500 [Bacteriovorax sp.]|nr:hypothetical protein [Bacteriovorax sp.]